jgi:type I restriction enzyme S subunit
MLALKHILKLKKDIVGRHSSQYDLLSLTLKGVVKRDMENPEGKFPASFDTYQAVEPNDFIFCNFDNEETPRAVGLSPYKGMITGAYDVLSRRNPKLTDGFLIYYFLYIDDAKRFKPLYKGLRKTVPFDSFMSYKIPVPSVKEQDAIVSYLDTATAKIDSAIAQQQKMIDLLNERKQIIINNAVTKGLNPNAKMKDSGVEWIGEVPEEWKILPIKHFKSSQKNAFVDGPFGSNLKSEHYIENGAVYVIESGMVTTGKFIEKDFKTISLQHFKTINRSECKAGDIIIAKIGAKFGMAAELPDLGKPCVVSGNSLKLTLDQTKMLNPIFVYNMELAKTKGGFLGLYQETAQPALSLGGLNNMCFAVPPIEEQREIASYLNTNLKKIDDSVSLSEAKISLLQERKQIIINEVVTGKIRIL